MLGSLDNFCFEFSFSDSDDGQGVKNWNDGENDDESDNEDGSDNSNSDGEAAQPALNSGGKLTPCPDDQALISDIIITLYRVSPHKIYW